MYQTRVHHVELKRNLYSVKAQGRMLLCATHNILYLIETDANKLTCKDPLLWPPGS